MGPRDGGITAERETLLDAEIVFVVVIEGDSELQKTGVSDDREVPDRLIDGDAETLCDLVAVSEIDIDVDFEAERV